VSSENNQEATEVSSFSCNLSALDQEQRKRHNILARDLLPKHLEIKELPDGCGFRFPNNRLLFIALSEWITLEQLCCPFLTLTLELQRDQGPIWLRATGEDGVKNFLRAELGIWRDLTVPKAIIEGSERDLRLLRRLGEHMKT
jgi:hypothetical protein